MRYSNKDSSIGSQVVLIGKIVSLHGLKGTVKVRSFSESMSLYESLNDLLLEIPGNCGLISMKVVWAKPYRSWIYLRLKNSESKTSLLIGSNIYVKKAALPPLEENTYFWFDLIGMSVKTIKGERLGCISSIIRTGGNDVYIIKPSEHGLRNEILIPAIKSVILDVNIVTRLMIVDLPKVYETRAKSS